MNRRMLDRYERASDGRIIVDIAASRIEFLYNDFDKNAPFIRRDLNQDLVDYLVAGARELKREPFILQFTLDEAPDDDKQSRIRKSIHAYFLYLAECEQQRVLQMFRRAGVLFCIGLAVLFLSVTVNQALGPERSVVANVFAEGLTVAAWVSLWESLAVFMIEWFPLRRNTALYRLLAEAELTFAATEDTALKTGAEP
ncbi:hypothetical protein BVX99_00330 [bacterium F16]|nr:hypothetical protein BVX99_00330 [bacterium F16]